MTQDAPEAFAAAPARDPLLRLGVNIDHVATLRQVRGTTYPEPLEAARASRRAGADSITVHLREDRRHIQDSDLQALRAALSIPLNLEMANAPEILAIALRTKPEEVCLVPERRQERTTEGGLDAAGQEAELRPGVAALQAAGVAVSLFLEADPRQLDAAARLGVPFVELHTGRYAELEGAAQRAELEKLIRGARHAHGLGLRVNAGHGINRANLAGILEIPHLETLNIGHSLIARARFTGLEAAVREMRAAMAAYRGGRA